MLFTINSKQFATALAQAAIVATKGFKRDHDDAKKITLNMEGDELTVMANGGYVAIATKVRVSPPVTTGSITLRDAILLERTVASFPPSSQLVCETFAPANLRSLAILHLRIRDISGGVVHTLEGGSTPVIMPTPLKKAKGKFQISRSEFMNAAQVVKAVGWEKHNPEFMHWVLRVRLDGYRAAAGCGARFLVQEKEGRGVVQCRTSHDLILLGQQTQTLVSTLGKIQAEQLKVRDSACAALDQAIFKADNTTIYLIGQDSGIKWPDENKFLQRLSPYRFVCKLSDWAAAMKGVKASYDAKHRKANQLHFVTLTLDPTQRTARLESSGAQSLKFEQIIPLCDLQVPVGSPPFVFVTLSQPMTDIPTIGKPHDYIQLEFVAEKKPMVVRFSSAPFIQDDFWVRDEGTMTRQCTTTFFASIERKTK